jgi:hypothetical protein
MVQALVSAVLRRKNKKPLPVTKEEEASSSAVWRLLIFQVFPDGLGTVPTLRGLPRDHRAVPSLALDEGIQFG